MVAMSPPARGERSTSFGVREGRDTAHSHRPIRILLAEDHDDTRDALSMLLQMEGYEVYAARDGQEALAMALERRPDIVITDFDMPQMDGASLSRALRASSSRIGRIPIVVLTALGWSLAQRAMEAGADLHIAKPVDFHVLEATLARLAGQLQAMASSALDAEAADGKPGTDPQTPH
jgi:CheY-like chemotaxis protein